jgi:hypothetical protein
MTKRKFEVRISRTRKVDEEMVMEVEAEDSDAAEEYAQQCINECGKLPGQRDILLTGPILAPEYYGWTDLHSETSYDSPIADEV